MQLNDRQPRTQDRRRAIGVLAAVFGFMSAALALAVPLLPVVIDEVTLSWPQPRSGANVTAPLVAYAPLDLEATIPCAAAATLPSYLRDDLGGDWGELERYTPRVANSGVARLQTTPITRSGI